MDEAAAVALVRDGNAEAFSDIVEHYHAVIYAVGAQTDKNSSS